MIVLGLCVYKRLHSCSSLLFDRHIYQNKLHLVCAGSPASRSSVSRWAGVSYKILSRT